MEELNMQLISSPMLINEQHVKERHPFIDIPQDISCHKLVYFPKEGKRKVDQQPTSTIHSPVLATYIQPCVLKVVVEF
jgi:hypothetical protein